MKKLVVIIIALVAVTSCQKVIDVDLNESNPKVVIEANYTAQDSTVNVHLSYTSSYFNSDPSQTIDNATVTITDQSGTASSVPFTINGNYVLMNYIPQFDSRYTLSVVVDGTEYTAECNLATPVSIDDITFEYFPPIFGGEDGYSAFLNFQDPAAEGDYYAVVLSRNGEVWDQITDMITQDDGLTNGNYVERPMFSRELFDLGDTVTMEMRTIDKSIFDYINETASIAGGGGGGSAAPGNPTNNWNNGALGYFSAYSVSVKTGIVQ